MQRLERVPALLEQLIKQQVNSAELRARLDEIAGAVAPAPTDSFRIYVISQNQGGLGVETYTCPYRDIPASLAGFRHVLSQLPQPVAETADVLILRWRDEQEVGAATPTSAGNTAVVVLPRAVVAQFGDQHLAFTYLKSRIEAHPQ
jgi:hypothetical protein